MHSILVTVYLHHYGKLLSDEGLDVAKLEQDIIPHVVDFATAPATATRIICDAHQQTWFTCPGSGACVETHRGSRPGSPIADLAYNILMSALLKRLQQALHQLPLLQQAHSSLGIPAPIVAWVDDIALPLPCSKAVELDTLLQQTMKVVHSVFHGFGLRLNCNRGKTEAVVQYRGPGAPAKRRDRFIHEFSQLDIPGHPSLHIATHYTHLGLVVAQNCELRQDLKTKLGKAAAAFRSMGRAIFHNKKLAIQTRLKLFDMLILPILFYGSGCWPLLPARLFNSFASAITKWQRQIVGDGFWVQHQSTDAEFRAFWRIPPLAVQLAKHRLLFLLQLHQHAPILIWDMVTAEDQLCSSPWLDAIRHALRWLNTMQADLPALEWTQVDILMWLREAPPNMAQQIRRAMNRFLTQEQTIHHVASMHRSIKQMCNKHGVRFDDFQPADEAQSPDFHVCSLCSRTFSTVQGLNAHRWRQHGCISEERKYVYSGVCECCRKCFWTSQRLQQHLKYSRRKANGCYWWIQQHLDPLDGPERVVMPDIHKGQFRLPCVPAHGPSPQDVTTIWLRRHSRDWQIWQEEWQRQGFPEDLSADLCQEVHKQIEQVTIEWRATKQYDLTWAWCEVVESYGVEEARNAQATWAFALWGRYGMYDFLEAVEDIDDKLKIEELYLSLLDELPIAGLIDRLEHLHRAVPPEAPLPDCPAPVQDQRTRQPLEPFSSAYEDSHALLAALTEPEVCEWPVTKGVPVCELPDGTHALVLVHLFSGRRRSGDCHDWAHQLVTQYFPGFKLIMLSLDTAVGGSKCDLLDGPGIEALLRIVEAGIVAGSLSGPPCETWSAARHLPQPPGSVGRWPRPLRSAHRRWGIQYLTHRELRQVATGSALMLSNVRLEIGIVLGGGAALMEHPEIPDCEDFASVWRTPLQSRICKAAPGHQRLHIQQWKYGADSIKPTLLRAMGLPPSAAALHRQVLPGLVKPSAVLAGRDEATGQFKTARAKEYPEGLCAALMHTLLGGLAARRSKEKLRIVPLSLLGERDQKWLAEVEALSHQCHVTHFLPDYQPK